MANTNCVKCRREGAKLLLKGERCFGAKCSFSKRSYAPGDHGQGFKSKISDYGKQLREKQKAKRIYGMREAQFASNITKAEGMIGNKSTNMMILLETRLDNIVYRLNLAPSRSAARQIVSHGGVRVNGVKTNIASCQIKLGDTVEMIHKDRFDDVKVSGIPTWIDFDAKKLSATVNHLPAREEIDTPINENLIIEFYSR